VLYEQLAGVRGKGSYQLRSTMMPLNYLLDVSFECGLGDVNVAAFTEAVSIIGECDTVVEFLACGIWPLSEKCDFEVETKEMPLSKVVVTIPKVTPVIEANESGAAFEKRILQAANLLVGNYSMMEHNACDGLCYGRLNLMFELAGVLCQLRPEPVAHAPRKWKAATATQAPAPKKATKKRKHPKLAPKKVSSRSGDQTSA
jgi:hypothetical protein